MVIINHSDPISLMLTNSMRLKIIDNEFEKPIAPGDAQSDLQVWKDPIGNIIALGYSADGYHWMDWPGVATFRFDDSLNICTFPVANSNVEQITDLFYRNVVPLVVQSCGIEVLHASAILSNDGVIAFCADSGTGKSTLAYGLAQQGYRLWADDAVAISSGGRTFVAHAIPFLIRLLPDSRSFLSNNETRKFEEIVPAGYNESSQTVRLLAICLLKRESKTDTWISLCYPSEAFTRLLSHAYYFQVPDPQHKRVMMENYLKLAERIPVYQIYIREGFQYLGELINQVDKKIKELSR